MDKDLEKYYNNRFDMTSSEGWNDLMVDLTQMENMVSHIANSNSADQLAFRKGQLDVILWLKNLRKTAKAAFAELSNEGSND